MNDNQTSERASQTRDGPGGAPDWIDREKYPFESRYVDLEPGRVHYVDEGEGRPLLMLHGNPTWSFVYRHLIRGLSDDYRCIAPDFLGFGLSDKPRLWSYRPADHARVVERFVEELGLEDLTLFAQDWGGPTGMDYATKHPENVRSFVVMNTAMWPLDDAMHVRLFSGLAGSRPARHLDRRYNLIVDRVMPLGFGDRSRLTPEIHRHYREPLRDPDDRTGAWVFPRELVGSTSWLADLWDRRRRVAGKPALLCWGMKRPLFGREALGRWQALFPDAETVEFPEAGHFVQEERGPEMVPEVEAFLSGQE
ncbi:MULTISPECIES: alpha/beta fold hydrolase [Halorussus]|uniref:alpha/beta fold hydrolase n=1 Tax=Halorussus TaxID=1070314 RepID=UPI00209F9519|nr:alpha/beta fold hydrolase [Halorussus vallis]USZ76334.1 alpha/beta fold hydrolase [Halorussus vallis]